MASSALRIVNSRVYWVDPSTISFFLKLFFSINFFLMNFYKFVIRFAFCVIFLGLDVLVLSKFLCLIMASIDISVSNALDAITKGIIKETHADVKKSLNVRRGLRQSVTKTADNLSKKPITDTATAKSMKEKFIYLKTQLLEVDEYIRDVMLTENLWDETKYDAEHAHSMEYIDVIYLSIQKLDLMIDELNPSQPDDPPLNPNNVSSNPKMNLPKLELPKFDGRPEYYLRFITQFESVIDKFNLSSFEKYTYLQGQLSGPAKELLNAIPVNEMKYSLAKNLLDKAYQSGSVQMFAVLDRLVNLKMNEQESFQWISDLNMLNNQVKDLKLDVDCFIQYFAWHSLTENFKQQFIQITNDCYPSLDLILNNAFEANRRLKEINSEGRLGEAPDTTILATNISKPGNVDSSNVASIKCHLCSDNNHFPKDCTKFGNALNKFNRAKQLGLCVKCAKPKHKGFCRNLTRKCTNCNKWHFNFMCAEPVKSIDKNATKSSKSVSCIANNITSSGAGADNDILLPTFSAKLKGQNHDFKVVHAAFDTWSSSNFILESFANKLNCKVISKVKLNIKGFNSVKTYDANIVEAEISIDDKSYIINAVSMQQFDLSVFAPGLDKVVKIFKDKGYRFADRYLSQKCNNNLSGIKFILGSSNAGILPITTITYGTVPGVIPSYFMTPIGIMLQGSVSVLMKSANELPDFQPNSS